MNWDQAQGKIRVSVKVGTDLNTPASNYRFVKSVDSIINSQPYGYHSECGFVVSIGQSRYSRIKIPWSMLEECFYQLNRPDGYDGEFFSERFPLQAERHPCHVHVVGRTFVVAGIARAEEGKRKDAWVYKTWK